MGVDGTIEQGNEAGALRRDPYAQPGHADARKEQFAPHLHVGWCHPVPRVFNLQARRMVRRVDLRVYG
jgi:hypothetical protein